MVDVVIVGGGPAGLSAALSLGRARREVVLVDEGRGRNAAAQAVYGYLGHEGVSPRQLRELARAEIARYPTVTVREEHAKAVTGAAGAFVVSVDGEEVEARRLLLATGVWDDLPRIDGLGELWGRGVFHCPYCHAFELCEEKIAVLATEPDDVSLVAKLACYSDAVTVLTNGAFELPHEKRELLHRLRAALCEEPIARLESVDDRLRCIVFASGSRLAASALFVHGTTHQVSDLPAALGCHLLDDGSIEVDDMQQTSVPGVYAAGDIARRPSQPLPGAMVVLAAAAGTVAGVAIDQDLLKADLP